MRAALDLMAEMPVEGRRIAVLGDMLELGVHSNKLHAALAAPLLFLPRLHAEEPWEANEVIQKHRRAALAVLKPT